MVELAFSLQTIFDLEHAASLSESTFQWDLDYLAIEVSGYGKRFAPQNEGYSFKIGRSLRVYSLFVIIDSFE